MQLAYLPDRKREYIIDDDAGSCASELSVEGRDDVTHLDELVKDYKRNKRRGMLGWFKLKVSNNGYNIHLPTLSSLAWGVRRFIYYGGCQCRKVYNYHYSSSCPFFFSMGCAGIFFDFSIFFLAPLILNI